MITFELCSDKKDSIDDLIVKLSDLGIEYSCFVDEDVYSVEGQSSSVSEEFIFWLAKNTGVDVFDITES